MVGQTSCFASTVVLQWDPNTETDLSGYRVYYQADSTTQPFQGPGGTPTLISKTTTTATISGLDSAHAYNFAVTAYNTSGAESVYSNIVSVSELVSPTVSISNPTNNASASGTVSVTANASDNVGVTKVEFYVNGTLQATDTLTPYLYSWNTASLTAGSYTLLAKAYDAAGNVGQSSNVAVTVVKDTTAPTVSVTAPANNATVSGTTTITVSASDTSGISKVEFYEDGALLSASNVAPYSYSWNTASVTNSTHSLYAKAYDAAGNVGQTSNVTVTVNNPVPDTTVPKVNTFTLPTTATSLTVPISSFTASDNVGVTSYCVTTANSSTGCTWSGTAPSSVTFGGTGARTVWAWARDAAGNISAGASASTTITVSSGSSITIGETNILDTDDSGNGNLLLAQSTTLGQTATIQSLSFYVTTASGNLRLGIYDATGTNGGPGNLVALTAQITPITGWNTATVTTQVSLSAGTYWLAFLPSSGSLHCSHTYTSGNSTWNSFTYGSMPSTYPTSQSTMTAHWSFYATLSTGDTTTPTVSVTAPANNTTVGGTTTITANASDNVGVTKVEFYVNGSLSSTATASPYSFSWNTTPIANGSYILSAKAYDAAGNVGLSSNTMVTVSNSHTVSATAGSGGAISPAGNSVVNYGGSRTFSITPATGYHIAGVTADGSSVGAVTSYTFSNVIANHTISATFAVNTYTLTYTAGANGTISGSTPQTVNSGGSGTLVTAVANTGYHFVSWSDGVITAARTDSNVTANKTVSATFAVNTTTSINIGETSILSGDDSGNGNLLLAQTATLGQTATIKSLSFYVSTASGKLRLGIYDATGTNGGPGKLVASTAEITPVTGWNTANVTTSVSINAGTYWLAFLPSSSSLHCSHTYATGATRWSSYTYGAIPTTFTTSQNSMTSHWSFYATLVK
jgi:hypothetical protein